MYNPDIDVSQLLPEGALLQGGKYRVERYLSSGNFGNTYIVQNMGMHVYFAMKEFFLRNICYRTGQGHKVAVSHAVDPEKVAIQRDKFKKEAQRLYGLTSRHLVHVHDMFEENGTVYYVMDYVQGESLASYTKRQGGQLSEQQVRGILNQLLEGLEEIHKKQIWHLDLKPDNIMIDNAGNVVIIDFGASKQVGQSGNYTGTSNILCYTPGYAPLEQVNQNMEAIGPWTDIYALGATLYNLLTGIDPTTVSPSMLQWPVPVSMQMRRMVADMMKIERERRPQSVAAVRRMLSTTVVGSNVNEHKKWFNIVVAVISVVALVIAIIFFVVTIALSDSSCSGGSEPIYQDTIPEVSVVDTEEVDNLYFETAYGPCSYTGPVDEEGKPHGMGVAKYNDGRNYIGPFVNGVMEGDDAFFIDDEGNIFQGSYRANLFEQGRYTWADDGSYFVGTFKNNQPDQGKYYNKNGNEI